MLLELEDVGLGTKVADALVMKPVERHLVFGLPAEPGVVLLVKPYGALLMLGTALLSTGTEVLAIASWVDSGVPSPAVYTCISSWVLS